MTGVFTLATSKSSMDYEKLVELLRETDGTLTCNTVGRAIKEAFGDRAYLVVEAIQRHD